MKILAKIRDNFSPKSTPSGFSAFFTDAASTEKKRIIKRAIKKANDDQKDLVSRYDRKYAIR